MSAHDADRRALLERAYAAIETQQARIRELEARSATEPLAIVGLSCRLPGAADPEAYWNLLTTGTDATGDVPAERWDAGALYDPDPDAPGRMYTRRGGFLRDVAGFDAAFFSISPREALAMDPQQRLLLETTWDALDRAGQPRDRLAGSQTGVFIGITANEYAQTLPDGLAGIDAYRVTGNTLNAAAGRIAYTLGFRGPAVAIDTACSSSLVAVHLACAAIRQGDCDQAIAGGVHLILSPAGHVALSRARVLSPEGRCRTFSAAADGMARGEGCGVIVIRRLSDALRDGDPIVAVIRGSAVNQDGPSGGLTVPSGPAQEDVIRRALASARIEPADVGYIEAHGTATPLGDPIEIAALANVFGSGRPADAPLLVGSVKTNLGHLEAAAGIAGLIKLALSLERERIPPHLHFDEPSPHIPWGTLPISVVTEARAWPRGATRRIAGISAFGFSGTNAHVILEEAPPVAARPEPPAGRPEVIRLAARSEAAFRELARRYAAHVEAHHDQPLADICHTANTGRGDGAERGAVVAIGRAALAAGLRSLADGAEAPGVFRGRSVERRREDLGLERIADRRTRLERAAAAYAAGTIVDWAALDEAPRRLVILPAYPWQRERFWPTAAADDRCDGWMYEIAWRELKAPVARRLPAGRDVEQQLASSLSAVRNAPATAAYADALDALERRAIDHAAQIVDRLRTGSDSVVEPCRPLFDRVREIAREPGARTSLEPLESLIARFPDAETEFRVLERCTEALSDVLAGRRDPLNVLFPDDGSASAAHLYGDAPAAVIMNRLLEDLVRAIAGGHDGGPLRVLEVGAGTGGTTAAILAGLRDARVAPQYTFTDVSPAFFARARERFPDATFLTTARLDITAPPAEQGFAPGAHDVVIAANVLHATPDLGRCLAHAAQLVAPGGLLVVQEWTAPMAAIDLIFGLTPGWWRFSDRDVRPSHPLVDAGRWQTLLEAHGFEDVATIGSSPSDRGALARQALLVARRKAAAAPVVIVGDPEGTGTRLRAALVARGHDAQISVRPPTAFAPNATIVDLRALDNVGERVAPDVVSLVQQLGRAGTAAHLQIVTRGAVAVDGEALPGVAQSPAWGIGKVAALEHPELAPRLIDLDPSADPVPALTDALGSDAAEAQVAVRRGRLFVPRLVAHRPPRREPLACDRSGAYVITGGFGGLGLVLAEWLHRRGAGLIVLAGRRAPSPDAAAAIAALERQGARLLVREADVTLRAHVEAVLDEVRATGMRVAAIFHAAGVLDDGVVAQMSEARLARALAPKVQGTWNLHEATRADRLDAFVLFSAATSLFGSAGQASHAAANAFLDSFAAWRRAGGLPALSINWGAWSHVGAAASGTIAERVRLKGLQPIDPERGLDLLERLMQGTTAQVGAFAVDWDQVPSSMRGLPFLSELVTGKTESAPVAVPAFAEEFRGAPAHRQGPLLAAHVRSEIRRVLGLGDTAAIDMTQGLFEIGFDSLSSMDLRNRLQETCGCALSSTLAFDCPTPDAVVTHLLGLLTPEATPAVAGDEQPADRDDIAIVGLGCRFPGADGVEAYWRLLREGVDAIREIPASRWNIDALYSPDPDAAGKMYTRHGGFLDGIESFDAGFFGVSPREALSLDPQQRLLLESCWEALEHAGIAPDSLAGSAGGVFIGIGGVDYYQRLAARAPSEIDAYMASGNAHSTASGRLSYVFGLRGPSLSIDTACSSSLVAIHLACRSLRAGECDLALTGGVSVILSPAIHVNHCRSRMLAPDGRCKTFDASADGFIRSEGCGVVVLKRLGDAERAGDRILAVIRGSAVNQDGRTSALTVPNGPAQQAVIRAALADAGVEAAQITYVEAHGTGTSLGDPIEAEALGAVFDRRREPLAIGSVKANIGHAEAAAGVAGLIKVVLAMQHREIPPQLHFTTPNPRIAWSRLPLTVPTARTAWGAPGTPLLAGVSAFGFGGTNAHLIVSTPAPSQAAAVEHAAAPPLLVLSAKSDDAIRALAAQYRDALTASPAMPLAAVCAEAALGRARMPVRAVVAGDSVEQLRAGLERVAPESADPDRSIAFVYPGQGALRWGMGRELYESHAAYRAAIDRCDAALRGPWTVALVDVLYADSGRSLIERTEFAQAALFATEYALTEMWASLGIRPSGVVGHSVGEFAAACAAGVLDVETACRLLAARGRLMQPLGGRMAALGATETRVRELLAFHPGVEIAAFNGRRQAVVSGPVDRVDAVMAEASRAGIAGKALAGDVAFHSALMDPMLRQWEQTLSGVRFTEPTCDWVSTVTARDETAPDARYWVEQVRRPVRYAAAAERLWALGHRLWIEVGPSAGLATLAADAAGAALAEGVWIAGLKPGTRDWDTMRESVARMFVAGAAVDWRGWFGKRPVRVALPTYPFERTRYWIDAPASHTRADAPAYVVRWESALPADRGARLQPDQTTPIGTWAVCGGRADTIEAAASRLEAHGARVIRGFAGHSGVAGVLHVGALDLPRGETLGASDLETALVDGSLGVIETLRRTAAVPGARVWVVTRGALDLGDRRISLTAAPVWGLGRVAALEHPDTWGGLIDLDPQSNDLVGLERVLDERAEDQLAVRGGRTLVPRLAPASVPAHTVAIRGDATYLITGGLGALGLEVAAHLVERGARHLVLVGRRAPDEAAGARIETWRGRGVDVRVERADVTNRDQMRRVLSAVAPPLRGVVHAAGANGSQAMADLDAASMRAVLSAKVSGAWVLHELTLSGQALSEQTLSGQTLSHPLDFFVAFSSIASVWGSKGQAHYAAGNAFLDALVSHRNALGLPGVAMQWGPWSAGGMATAGAQGWLARVGVQPLPTDAALSAFDAWLTSPGCVVVADVAWPRFLEVYESRRRHPFFTAMAPAPTTPAASETSSNERPLTALRAQGPADGRRALARLVQDHVVGVLNLDPRRAPAPHQGFFTIGFDSLLALELRNRLAAALGVALPSTLAFDYPTVRDLAEYLARDVVQLDEAVAVAPASDMDASIEAVLGRLDRVMGKP